MPKSDSQRIAQQKYNDANYDRLAILIRKGKREEYKSAAAELGFGYAEMIRLAIDEFIQRHGGEVNLPEQHARIATHVTQPAEQLSASQRRLLDAVEKLPADAQKSLLKFLQSLSNVAAENKAESTAKNASVDNHEPI